MFLIIGVWGGGKTRFMPPSKFFLYTAARFAIDAGRGAVPVFSSPVISSTSLRGTRLPLPLGVQIMLFFRLPRARLRSRCRCGRCIPGCRMRTSKRRPVAPWCWAAIMLKLGAYGFLRFFRCRITPDASHSTVRLHDISLASCGDLYRSWWRWCRKT